MYSPRWEHSTGQTPEPFWEGKFKNVRKYEKYANKTDLLTLTAVIATETRIALAMAHHTLAIVRAPVRAVLGHVFGNCRVEGQFLVIPIVVVDGEEPVARLHVLGYFSTHRRLWVLIENYD